MSFIFLSRPSPNSAIFITLIVKFPIIQILTILTASFMVALEYPLPQLKGTVLHRSIVLRIVVLIMQASMAVLFYQVRILLYSEVCSLPMLVLTMGLGTGNKWGTVVAYCGRMLWACVSTGRDDGGGEE